MWHYNRVIADSFFGFDGKRYKNCRKAAKIGAKVS